ncbi:MAG: enoyl-CoA hydratase [Hyphomicrobiales bacterium]|nr:MAG: enoyl-CoA hydratase [Hyphomicrobiales bacterium]
MVDDDNPVVTTDHGNIRIVRINRPTKRNALNLDTKRRLVTAFRDADADSQVRVVIVTGTPEVFVAGTDIAEMATLRPTDHLTERTGEVFEVLDGIGKPTIAAVEGFALGGGCELALATDTVIAGAGAQFGQPEIRVGLIPGAGGTHRLVKMAGRQRALRLLLTGDRFDAEQAHQLGIVSEIVPDGTALDRATALAEQLLALPPLSLQLIKELARNAEDAPLRSGLMLERRAFQLIFDSEDHTEGLNAFLERRTPSYHGR